MATIEDLQSQIALSKQYIAQQDEQMQNAEQLNEREAARGERIEENIRLANLLLDLQKQDATLVKQTKEELEEILKIETAQLAQSKKLVQAYTVIADTTETWVQALTGISGQSKGLLFSMREIKKETGSYARGLLQAAEQINKQITLASTLKNAMSKVFTHAFNFGMQLDRATAGFKAASGAGDEFAKTVDKAAIENSKYGISVEATFENVSLLRREMTNITFMSQEAQAALGGLASQYQKLGVDATSFAKTQESLNLSMNMNTEDAKVFSKELLDLGTAMGDPNKAFRDFVATAPTLARYGKDAPEMFKNIAIQAKSMGIEMQDLLGIVAQFDTFEGAATSVGKLNALLGGNYLNSLELLNAKEGERIEILKASVAESGKSWDTMQRFERLAIASAAGIEDMEKANRLFGQSSEVYDANKASLEEQAKTQKSVEERLIDAMTLQEKYMGLWSKLFEIVRPVLDLLHGFMNILATANEHLGGFGVFLALLAPLAIKAAAKIAILALKTKLFGAAQLQAAAAANASGAASAGMGAKAMAAGKAASAGAKGVLAFGAAIFLVGAGLAVAASGLALLMSQVDSWEDVAALAVTMTGFAAIVFIFGKAAMGAAPGTLALGGGIALIGVGIGIAAAGLSLLVMGLSEFTNVLIDKVLPVADQFAAILISFSMGISGMAMAAIPAAIGLGALAVGFGALAISLALIKTADLIAIADIFKSMATFATNGGAALGNIPAIAENLVEKLESVAEIRSKIVSMGENLMIDAYASSISVLAEQLNIAADASERLNKSLQGPTKFIEAAVSLETKGTSEITQFVQTLTELTEKEAESSALKELTETIKGLNKESKAGGSVSKQPIVIELQIGNRVVKKVIEDYFESEKKQVLGVN